MIPLRAEKRADRFPWVTTLIAIACVAALARLASLPAPHAATLVRALAVTPAGFAADPLDVTRWPTLLTSTVLHAGWVHLAGNMLFLAVFAPLVESRLGVARFAGLYAAAGIAGGLAHIAAHPGSTAPLVGASGAIAGILGAFLVLEPRTRITTVFPILVFFEVASLPAAFVIGLWFLLQLASSAASVAPGVAPAATAWFAHIGGFCVGLLVGAAVRGTSHDARSAHSSRRARN